MFSSFFSKLRFPTSSTHPQDDGDDTSSLGRSLNLPWPVTESSARRPITPKREWASNSIQLSQTSGSSGVSISHPIPRTTPNSFTGFDDFPMPPSGIPKNVPPRTPISAQAQAPYAPPEVVRLSDDAAEDNIEQGNEHRGFISPPPKYQYEYTVHPSASSYALPYPGPSVPAQQSAAAKSQNRDFEDDNGAELYTSPFEEPLDAVPTAPRSTSSLPSTPNMGGNGNGATTKGRWNLKLQLNGAGSRSTTSLPTSTAAPRPSHAPPIEDPFPRPSNIPSKHLPVLDALPYDVETDVFNGAYDYPLAKQLSPIAELSPGPESDSRSVSLRFGMGGGSVRRPSPGADSLVGSVLAGGPVVSGPEEKDVGADAGADVADRESLKTRTSRRTGSIGSVGTLNGNGGGRSRSRSSSVTMGAVPLAGLQNASPGGSLGSEITRPSPIHPSPFLTRHLNRTVSQTSSKSDSQIQPSQSQAQLQRTASSTGPGSRPNTGISNAPTSTREVPQTPISPGTAATTPTGTMYTPTSTLQTPVAQTPISAGAVGGPAALVIQPPPAAVTTNPLPPNAGSSALSKIPSLPVISPIDLRFSIIGSVAPRASREVQMSRHSRAVSAIRQSLGQVDRLPVIEGSVDGFYEEEVETEESDDDGYEEDEEEDEEYERESLHAESFVTAGTNEDASNDKDHMDDEDPDPEVGVELATLGRENHSGSLPAGSASSRGPSASASNSGSIRSIPEAALRPDSRGIPTTPGSVTGESFIHRRWDRDAAISLGRMTSSPTTMRAKRQGRWLLRLFSPSSSSTSSSFTPAFWAFWLGFLFPVLWLVGGWHFTNAGELPPKVTVWEWYFWNSHWSVGGFKLMIARLFACCRSRKLRRPRLQKVDTAETSHSAPVGSDQAQRRRGKRRSHPDSRARIGKVYPALPRWVAERQTTDDGRIKLNDPKRSMRGISFGYPFISRPGIGSQDSSAPPNPPLNNPSSSSWTKRIMAVLSKPNRLLDLMYGVKLTEVRGRPENGRRMFDPWIQRCRYAFCYGLALIAIGLCTASVYLIIINTKKLQ